MPSYTIRMVNEHFSHTAEQQSADNMQAWKTAIASAVTIAADQVSYGNPFFSTEVTLELGEEDWPVFGFSRRNTS
jgi:hypothetical protein